MGGLGVETIGEQSFRHGAISVGFRGGAHHAVVQMHVDLVEEGMHEQVDGTARGIAQWARMNSKCAKNKYSFKTLEKVNVASDQGVCGPVEYDGHIFKTV